MGYCLNPTCLRPQNPDNSNFCQSCGQPLRLSDRYRVNKLLGQGGFGRTFLAQDEHQPSQPTCVIKQFYPVGQPTSAKAIELFEQEAVRLEQLGDHDQIPTLYAYFSQDGQQYIIQQFVDGPNLAQEMVLNATPFTEAQIRSLLLDLLPVLTFIHQGNVIHRDIKPENIIRRRVDARLVLVDFGAAKYAAGTALLKTGTVIGSAEYTAPEQLRGKASAVSDLYSLGVTCLHLMTGLSPFDLFDVQSDRWMWQRCLSEPISDDLAKILDRMVSPSVQQRWTSSEAILDQLRSKSQKLAIAGQTPGGALQLVPRVDYEPLDFFLRQGQWEEADRETGQILVQLAQRDIWGWLRPEDIEHIPCADLQYLDQLWVEYSQGRFGFSVQKQIYRHMGGMNQFNQRAWNQFAQEVGWRRRRWFRPWVRVQAMTYDLSAPLGHLPRQLSAIGHSRPSLWFSWITMLWWTVMGISSRLDTCEFEAMKARQR